MAIPSCSGEWEHPLFQPGSVAQYIDDVPSGDVFTYSSELLSGNVLTVHRGGKGTVFGLMGLRA